MKDSKGFIRFNVDAFANNRVSRLQNNLTNMQNYFPTKDSDKWAAYPYKEYKSTHFVDSYTASPVNVFANRYLDKWLNVLRNQWIRISTIEIGERKCTTLLLMDIEWKNFESGQFIYIKGLNIDGKVQSIKINIWDLLTVAISIYSKEESKFLTNMINASMPDPIYPVFKIYHTYYSEHYDKYLKDCKLYNVTPLPKDMIDRLVKDIYISIDNGTMSGETDDTYVVNTEFQFHTY